MKNPETIAVIDLKFDFRLTVCDFLSNLNGSERMTK